MMSDKSEVDSKTDWKAIQILEIQRQFNNSSKYELKVNELQKLLEPIKDREVAIIPVVGPYNTGKSFILNHMCRHLTDPNSTDFPEGSDEALKVFEWRPHVDPLTSGLWLSKPFIHKQSNGEEIAILLMDTQGVFDGSSDRDSMTIFWLSLLISSALVFNSVREISEDILTRFETFLNYGFSAKKSGAGADNEYPFQSLSFLVRDWNSSTQFSYGMDGGQRYLNHKLKFTDSYSPATATRRLIKDSFKEINCCLMPYLGPKSCEENFRGSVDELSPRFVESLNQFNSNTFNINKIKPKMINNKTITGRELLQYFRVYVQLFNSTEQPKHIEIISSTTKTSDVVLIISLKETHFNKLKEFIGRKSTFNTRKELKIYNNQIRSEAINRLNIYKKSEFEDIIQELNESLKGYLDSNFETIFKENEIKRQELMEEVVKSCVSMFEQNMNTEIGNKFFETKYFEELCETIKGEVVNQFKESFGGEEECLFNEDFDELNRLLNNSQIVLGIENDRRISEAEKINSDSVNESLEYYKSEMQSMVVENSILTEEQFKQLEYEIKTNTRRYLLMVSSSGNSKFMRKFDLIFRERLSELKSEFKEKNRIKTERIIDGIEIDLIDSIEEYNIKLNQIINTIGSEEEFRQKELKLRENILDQFINKCVINEQNFLNPFKQKFEKKTQNIVENKMIEWKANKFDKITEKLLLKSKEIYINSMETIMKENKIYSNDELKRLNENIRNESLFYFESNFRPNFGSNSDHYLSELKQTINELFNEYCLKNNNNREAKEKALKALTNEYLQLYESRMRPNIHLDNNGSEVMARHKTIMREVVEAFISANETIEEKVLKPYLEKLEKMIKKSNSSAMKLFERREKTVEMVPQNSKLSQSLTDRDIYDGEENAFKFLQTSKDLNQFMERKSLTEKVKTNVKKISALPSETPAVPERNFTNLCSLNIIETSIDGKYRLNEQLLRSIVSKAENCDNFALISIIGQKYSGKSLFMNSLFNYLKSTDRNSWPKNCLIKSKEGFHNDSEDRELKPIVQMLSKPFILEDDDQRTAVFLMDSSNVFNDPTEISNSKLVEDIIGLFISMSSTVIYLKDYCFLQKDIENLKSVITENMRKSQMSSFQELFCVIRDWDPNLYEQKSYLFGSKGGKSYLANEFGNHELNRYFQKTCCHLMPSAGSEAKRPDVDFNRLAEQFNLELSHLIKHKLLNMDEMEVKKDLKTNKCLKPKQLIRVFRQYVNKMNGEYREPIANPEMIGSFENFEFYNSNESIDSIEILEQRQRDILALNELLLETDSD